MSDTRLGGSERRHAFVPLSHFLNYVRDPTAVELRLDDDRVAQPTSQPNEWVFRRLGMATQIYTTVLYGSGESERLLLYAPGDSFFKRAIESPLRKLLGSAEPSVLVVPSEYNEGNARALQTHI